MVKFKLIDLFINNSDPDFPVLPNSFDKSFVDTFTKTSNLDDTNPLSENIIGNFNKHTSDSNFNNSILNKFVSLNNKISKFNKKHMIEYVMPKSTMQFQQTSKFIIKNCRQNKSQPYMDEQFYCNLNCSLNFYKRIDWS